MGFWDFANPILATFMFLVFVTGACICVVSVGEDIRDAVMSAMRFKQSENTGCCKRSHDD